jgi:hypothetical protein
VIYNTTRYTKLAVVAVATTLTFMRNYHQIIFYTKPIVLPNFNAVNAKKGTYIEEHNIQTLAMSQLKRNI